MVDIAMEAKRFAVDLVMISSHPKLGSCGSEWRSRVWRTAERRTWLPSGAWVLKEKIR